MAKAVFLYEIAHKQRYIFKSSKLRDNIRASAEIKAAMETDIRRMLSLRFGAGEETERRIIYTGGGNATLRFDSMEEGRAFTKRYTAALLKAYPGMCCYAAAAELLKPDAKGRSMLFIKDAMDECHRRMEQKKKAKQYEIGQADFGALERISYPEREQYQGAKEDFSRLLPKRRAGNGRYFCFSKNLPILAEQLWENRLATIHIDGNRMGYKFMSFRNHPKMQPELIKAEDAAYRDAYDERYIRAYRKLSEQINRAYVEAFRRMTEAMMDALNETVPKESAQYRKMHELLLRPIILSGDDVTMITAGKYGISLAAGYLRELRQKELSFCLIDSDEETRVRFPLSACAGVSIAGRDKSFRLSYEIAEALCDNAKRLLYRRHEEEKELCAIDWNYAKSNPPRSLSEAREELSYRDGRGGDRIILCGRPYIMTDDRNEPRAFFHFENSLRYLRGMEELPYSKLSALRSVYRKGRGATSFFLSGNLLPEKLMRTGARGNLEADGFYYLADDKAFHGIYYDALELLNDCILLP